MNRTVLVVGHSEVVRTQVRDALLSEQCDVFEAGDKVDAFRKLNEGLNPELIIASIEEVRSEDESLVSAIRQISAYRHTPILIMNAETGTVARCDCNEAGGTSCIQVTFDKSELLDKIRLLMP